MSEILKRASKVVLGENTLIRSTGDSARQERKGTSPTTGVAPSAPILPSIVPKAFQQSKSSKVSDLTPQVQTPPFAQLQGARNFSAPANPSPSSAPPEVVQVKKGRASLPTPSIPSQLRYETHLEESGTEQEGESRSESRSQKRRFKSVDSDPAEGVDPRSISSKGRPPIQNHQNPGLRGEKLQDFSSGLQERVKTEMALEVERALQARSVGSLTEEFQIKILKSTLIEQLTQIKLTLLGLKDKEYVYNSRIKDLEDRIRFVENREREAAFVNQSSNNALLENCSSSHRRVEELERQLDGERRTSMELRKEIWERDCSIADRAFGLAMDGNYSKGVLEGERETRERQQYLPPQSTSGPSQSFYPTQSQPFYPHFSEHSSMVPSGMVGAAGFGNPNTPEDAFTSAEEVSNGRFQSLRQESETLQGAGAYHNYQFQEKPNQLSEISHLEHAPREDEGGKTNWSRETYGNHPTSSNELYRIDSIPEESLSDSKRSRDSSTTSEDLASILQQELVPNSAGSRYPSTLPESKFNDSDNRASNSLPPATSSSTLQDQIPRDR